MNDCGVKTFIQSYDIVGITETWSENENDFKNWISDMNNYSLAGTRRSKHGRCSGGITVFIKKDISGGVSNVKHIFKHAVFLKLDKVFFHFDENVLLAFAYVPPEASFIHNDSIVGLNCIEQLQETLLELSITNDYHIMCCGDLNARTGKLNDFIYEDKYAYKMFKYDVDLFQTERVSKDDCVNSFGKSLIELCVNLDVHILNGRKPGVNSNEYTSVTNRGNSVVDYILCSTELYDSVSSFSVNISDFTEMGIDHFPITCILQLPRKSQNVVHSLNISNNDENEHIKRFIWDVEKTVTFNNMLGDEYTNDFFAIFDQCCNDKNCDKAIDILDSIFQRAASSMQKRQSEGKNARNGKSVPWWDKELASLKSKRNNLLKTYRREHRSELLSEYIVCKKLFKTEFRNKQNKYKANLYRDVKSTESINDVWKLFRKIKRKSCVKQGISSDEWYSYFSDILDVNDNDGTPNKNEMHYDELCSHDATCNFCINNMPGVLNEEIKESEILYSIEHMKNNKAAGPDGLIAEMFKACKSVITTKLCKLFNVILDTGIFPERWGKAIIYTLHKSGDTNIPSNYRGISLLSVTSKVFTKVLNNRLVKWAEEENVYYEEQAGFRKEYSTIDQILSLYTIANKYISKKKGRMYAAFIDFSRAFDSVPHVSLLIQLIKRGVHGKIFTVLKSMYSKLKACVKTNSGITQYFDCTIGTRQGCMLSPFIFAMYLNEFVDVLKRENCRGIQVRGTNVTNEVNVLLYADDMVLCADTVRDLQNAINKLEMYCKEWKMDVNMKKSKVIVFRNGGPLKKGEQWYFNQEKIEIVSYYKYLGLIFSTSLKWNVAQNELAKQSNRAATNIRKLYNECGYIPPSILFKLFDQVILPILCYGSEVWGYKRCERIERVHMKFCKWVLGVSHTTSNMAVLSECGRYPLYIEYFTNFVKYWLKTLSKNENRLVRLGLEMSKTLDNNGRVTWSTNVRNLLSMYGFNDVWENGVSNIKSFLQMFKQRVKDCHIQEWRQSVDKNHKLCIYKQIKVMYEPSLYLSVLKEKKYISSIAKLRCSDHRLKIETGRHMNIALPLEERICMYCYRSVDKNYIEDEYHFLIVCPAYDDIRNEYLTHFISKLNPVNQTIVNLLLDSKNEILIQKLSIYVYKAMYIHMNNMTALCNNVNDAR